MGKDPKTLKAAKAKERPKSGRAALAGLRRRAQMVVTEGVEEIGPDMLDSSWEAVGPDLTEEEIARLNEVMEAEALTAQEQVWFNEGQYPMEPVHARWRRFALRALWLSRTCIGMMDAMT
eukprot:3156984-Pyramimonas_sp.AAC.1